MMVYPTGDKKQMFLNMVYALPSLQWLLRTVSAYSEPAGATFLALLNSKSSMWPCFVIHKNEVWNNGTSEQTHMGKKYLLTIAIPRLQTLYRKCGAQFARSA
ncbi:hypothetical protein TNCV_3056981 [Trichonephila clavipes]|nr:hypothetical protein TNCV_3056981 [Trichonephila clavipes]